MKDYIQDYYPEDTHKSYDRLRAAARAAWDAISESLFRICLMRRRLVVRLLSRRMECTLNIRRFSKETGLLIHIYHAYSKVIQ